MKLFYVSCLFGTNLIFSLTDRRSLRTHFPISPGVFSSVQLLRASRSPLQQNLCIHLRLYDTSWQRPRLQLGGITLCVICVCVRVGVCAHTLAVSVCIFKRKVWGHVSAHTPYIPPLREKPTTLGVSNGLRPFSVSHGGH